MGTERSSVWRGLIITAVTALGAGALACGTRRLC